MNRLSRSILLSTVAASLCFGRGAVAQSDPIQVVASFSILRDMVEQVAGSEATVTSLVGPNGDTHFFSPSPADARRLSHADLLVINGLELRAG